MLSDGWDGFVNKHGLEAMDVIRFYKPVQPLHEGHCLIECVKREEAASRTSSGQNDQLGGAENDDDRSDYWGDRASSGKDARPSPPCGSPGKGGGQEVAGQGITSPVAEKEQSRPWRNSYKQQSVIGRQWF
ncbi:unnamed protein product [Camellia sinensis]